MNDPKCVEPSTVNIIPQTYLVLRLKNIISRDVDLTKKLKLPY